MDISASLGCLSDSGREQGWGEGQRGEGGVGGNRLCDKGVRCFVTFDIGDSLTAPVIIVFASVLGVFIVLSAEIPADEDQILFFFRKFLHALLFTIGLAVLSMFHQPLTGARGLRGIEADVSSFGLLLLLSSGIRSVLINQRE